MGKVLVTILFLAAWLAPAVTASAQEYNHIITVYAVVPEQRVIYLDGSGNIIRIAGNTTKNITPIILDSNNNEVAMTPDVQSRYDDFLKQHHDRLQASRIYEVNPVTVDNSPNTQSIGLNSENLSLSGLQID